LTDGIVFLLLIFFLRMGLRFLCPFLFYFPWQRGGNFPAVLFFDGGVDLLALLLSGSGHLAYSGSALLARGTLVGSSAIGWCRFVASEVIEECRWPMVYTDSCSVMVSTAVSLVI
jgi:hypothetical protein